jgi:hypothetical protein
MKINQDDALPESCELEVVQGQVSEAGLAETIP